MSHPACSIISIMKRLLILLLAAIFSLPSFGQESTDAKWILSIEFGLQKHDKRLFDYPYYPKKDLLESQPESYGTYQFGISAVRKMLYQGRIEIYAGGGLSSELSTFNRPFDLNYRHAVGPDILLTTDRYFQNLLQLPIRTKLIVFKHLGLSLELLPQFNFLAIAGHKPKSFSWWMFDFYSVEVNPGLSFELGRFELDLNYRVLQFKKIDKILFNHLLYDFGNPRATQVFETYNPFKLWFSVGYKL